MASSIPSTPPFQYVQSEAGASLSKRAGVILKGRKTTRLKLGNDSRFYLAASVVKSGDLAGYLAGLAGKMGKKMGYYVEMKNGDDTVFLSINSIASRLHIKKETILEAAQKGELASLLSQKAEKASASVSSYEKIVSQFGQAEIGDPQTFMKVIRTVAKAGQKVQEFYLYKEYTLKGHTYQMGFNKEKKEVELVALDIILGQGTFGTAQKLTHALDSNEEAFKFASKPDEQAKAERDIQNEYQKLSIVHAKGKVWGIQEAPRQLIKMQDLAGSEKYGHIGVLYSGDYQKDLLNNPRAKFEDFLTDFHQILSGLKALSKLNILHGDLKDKNLLVKYDADGTRLIHIADMGGAQFADPKTDLIELAGAGGHRSFTPSTSTLEDLLLADSLAQQGKYDELVELEKQRDTFSIGCILYMALMNQEPYDENGTFHQYPMFYNLSTYHPITRTDVPQEIKDLIKQMLDPDPKKRPEAAKAFETFDSFLQTFHPNVHAQIQQKIQKEYPGSTSSVGP